MNSLTYFSHYGVIFEHGTRPRMRYPSFIVLSFLELRKPPVPFPTCIKYSTEAKIQNPSRAMQEKRVCSAGGSRNGGKTHRQ